MSTACKSIEEKTNNCLDTPYRSKFTVASRVFPVTARFLVYKSYGRMSTWKYRTKLQQYRGICHCSEYCQRQTPSDSRFLCLVSIFITPTNSHHEPNPIQTISDVDLCDTYKWTAVSERQRQRVINGGIRCRRPGNRWTTHVGSSELDETAINHCDSVARVDTVTSPRQCVTWCVTWPRPLVTM